VAAGRREPGRGKSGHHRATRLAQAGNGGVKAAGWKVKK
jgi:hypothetical protein